MRGSTFRLTLASCLERPLALVPTAPGRLDPASEARVSEWMRDHLEVAVFPLVDRDRLADLEHRVLREPDPPLNLNDMPPTPLRAELTRRRARLA
ncbi:MAG: GIY-YIG nuclease family protein [Solirubrobacteraceae bacterium]